MMVPLAEGQEVFKADGRYGTEGCFAPESLLNFEYSFKTDVWQAGCILYCMLCGHPPFHSDIKYRYQITDLTYYPMEGSEWEGISQIAKDLVRKMLDKDPQSRASMEDVLNHEWFKGSAPTVDLGVDYHKSVKTLALRQKLKRCFQDRDIENEHKIRKQNFESILPIMKQNSNSTSSIRSGDGEGKETPRTPSDNNSPRGGDNVNLTSSADDMDIKESSLTFNRSDSNFSVDSGYAANNNHGGSSDEFYASLKNLKELLLSSLISDREHNVMKGEIGCEEFINIMNNASLPTLANEQIFHIFDINKDGKIELKEFLLSLISLRSPDDDDAARLYFNLFDMDEDGSIGKEELRAVLNLLLHDGAGPLLIENNSGGSRVMNMPNIDELFDVIDSNRDGNIDYNEFKTFYDTILLPSTSRLSASIIHSHVSLAPPALSVAARLSSTYESVAESDSTL